MKAEQRIPSQLFLVAGTEIESALQQATHEAFKEGTRRHSLIATWENGVVALISHSQALSGMATPPVKATTSGDTKEVLESWRDEIFLDLVLRSAQRIYIKDEKLCIEFALQEGEFGLFLASPENDKVLRNICRDITGREMATQVGFIRQPHASDSRSVYKDKWRDQQLRGLIDILGEIGDQSLMFRIDALRYALEPRQTSNPSDKPRVPKIFPAEGDDLTSHEGK